MTQNHLKDKLIHPGHYQMLPELRIITIEPILLYFLEQLDLSFKINNHKIDIRKKWGKMKLSVCT